MKEREKAGMNYPIAEENDFLGPKRKQAPKDKMMFHETTEQSDCLNSFRLITETTCANFAMGSSHIFLRLSGIRVNLSRMPRVVILSLRHIT